MAPWHWCAMPAPRPAASPVRTFAAAISKAASPRSAARNAFIAAMPGRRRVIGEQRQVVLDRLEARDGPTELLALADVPHRLGEEVLEAARHLRRAHERAVLARAAPTDMRPAGAAAVTRAPLHVSVSLGSSARLTSGCHAGAARRDERDHVPRDDDDVLGSRGPTARAWPCR